jgi:hypothetical protein
VCVCAFRRLSIHSKDPAVSVYKSQDSGNNTENQPAPKFSERENGKNVPMATLTSLISDPENRPQHQPSAIQKNGLDMCAVPISQYSVSLFSERAVVQPAGACVCWGRGVRLQRDQLQFPPLTAPPHMASLQLPASAAALL